MFHILNIIIIYLNTLLTFQRQFSSGRSSLLFFVQPFANSRVWVREKEIARVCGAVFSMFFYHDCIFIISTGEYCSAKTEEHSQSSWFFFFARRGLWRSLTLRFRNLTSQRLFSFLLRRDFFLLEWGMGWKILVGASCRPPDCRRVDWTSLSARPQFDWWLVTGIDRTCVIYSATCNQRPTDLPGQHYGRQLSWLYASLGWRWAADRRIFGGYCSPMCGSSCPY